ncbi:hypothetical protein C8R43DRAFT_1013981 [Mycena crocata]|nr:hypothetical protein C8R43DRAFT_1013981 [Mycena crocata]
MPQRAYHKGSASGGPGIITPFTEDRRAWNQDWEREIAWRLSHGAGMNLTPIDIFRRMHCRFSTDEYETERQHMLAMHREVYGSVCQSLARLGEGVSFCFATHDFVNKWLSAPDSVREEHIQAGLVDACRGAEFFRMFCDELTLPFLQRDGGQGFLDLLKHFTLNDFFQVPKKPIYLESSHWYPADPPAELRAAYELADADFNLKRSEVIGMLDSLGRNLDGCMNRPDPACNPLFHGFPMRGAAIHGRKRGVARSRLSQMAEELERNAFGPAAAKERYRKFAQESKALPHISVCENCEKFETPGVQRFMRCKPCMENVSRKIHYCSRQCQREDWKIRHKRICGKTMTLQESEETANVSPKPAAASSTTPQIDPPADGFKRSPALTYQVNLLKEHLKAGTDYILVTRTNRVFRLKIDDDNEKRAFRRFRELALNTGDREAVAAIGQFLVKEPGGAVAMFGSETAALGGQVLQMGLDRQDAFDQLEREYGFDVKAAVKDLERERDAGFTEVEKEILSQDYPSW